LRRFAARASGLASGLDDCSRFCLIATVVRRATARAVCRAFVAAVRLYGIPDEVLTGNGKMFTGRFGRPRRAEVLFERICRRNGIKQLLTKPYSPTTIGKVELLLLDSCPVDSFQHLGRSKPGDPLGGCGRRRWCPGAEIRARRDSMAQAPPGSTHAASAGGRDSAWSVFGGVGASSIPSTAATRRHFSSVHFGDAAA
jgi:hypothetical protein